MSLTKHSENKTPPAGATNTHRRLTRQLGLAVDAADVHAPRTIVIMVTQRYQAVALPCVARDGRFCFCHCLARAVLQGFFDTLRADDSMMARRDYAIALLMFDTGLRRAEVASLRISAVNTKHRQISVYRAKRNRQRRVPVKEPVLLALQDWLDVHPYKHTDHLFVSLTGPTKGKQISTRRVNGLLESWCEKTGLVEFDRFTPHDLRRAFATYFSDTGGDMFALQGILGHRNIETTRGYVINTGKRLQTQHDKYSPVNLLNLG